MRYTKQTLILALASLTLCSWGYAQEEVKQTVEPPRAIWLEPTQNMASWRDTRTVDFVPAPPEILATGKNTAIAKLADGNLYAVDTNLNVLGVISLPENTQWFALDDKDRILAHNGSALFTSNSWQDTANPDAFTSILDIADVKAMDIGSDTLAYADSEKLYLINLTSGTIQQKQLADFFDDAKVAAMTPEAVLAAEEAAAKKKKPSKSSKKTEQEEAPTQVADIQGIWWRADGTGIIRVRSLMNIRTFITRDNGKSWTLDENAPQTLMHTLGGIWNGEDLVLSQDGSAWIKTCSQANVLNLANRWTLKHQPDTDAATTAIPDWMILATPAANEENTTLFANDENGELCLLTVPQLQATQESTISTPSTVAYNPQYTGGFKLGLMPAVKASDDKATAPALWMIRPEGNVETIAAPEDCTNPLYADSIDGLGILVCDKDSEDGSSVAIVYTRTADSEWVAETLLDYQFKNGNTHYAVLSSTRELMAAEDGTLVLTGDCLEEYGPAPELTEEEQALGMTPHEPPAIKACYYAVRNSDESLPNNERWRIERVENADAIVPLTGARILSVEDHGAPNAKSLVLRTPLATEKIVDNFDTSPYTGLVQTHEGCLALYDGSVDALTLADAQSGYTNPETGEYIAGSNVKLLSVNGTQAGLDCAQSRLIVESGMGHTEYVEEPEGDPRFGLRLGGGAMLSTKDVITWVMRVEALIPVYKGKYEVGLLYRMSGGNEAAATGHMGIVSMRWRYDELEKFDFAAGAGIGYGQACGYDRASDKNANDDDEKTKP
ncbi:MAG: hypothetical protein J6A01_12225, partial [Proteobacteria bacterium]|nr:hypothetical protein [Pseudomonadota bacterium]